MNSIINTYPYALLRHRKGTDFIIPSYATHTRSNGLFGTNMRHGMKTGFLPGACERQIQIASWLVFFQYLYALWWDIV